MDFTEYQQKAKKTAIYPENFKVYYPMLGLAGEVGELANKIKKKVRDDAHLDIVDITGEMGDVLWYLSAIATDLGIELDDVATHNIEKLAKRASENKLHGSGDNR